MSWSIPRAPPLGEFAAGKAERASATAPCMWVFAELVETFDTLPWTT